MSNQAFEYVPAYGRHGTSKMLRIFPAAQRCRHVSVRSEKVWTLNTTLLHQRI